MEPHLLQGRWRLENANSQIQPEAAAAAAKSLQSCPTLWNPLDGSPPGSPVPGSLQARTLQWVAISFSNAWKWKVKVKSLSRVQQPEAAQVKKTKNLNDCATYWRKPNSYSVIQNQLRNTSSTTTKTHSDTVSQKYNDNSPETKVMEYFILTVKEFKIAVVKKFNEQWERQINELMNKVNEQKEYFTKETETLKKKETNRTFLVVHWLRIHLPMQGTWIWSLILENPTCCKGN